MAPRVNRRVTRPARFLAYGLAGLAGELIFTAAKGQPRTTGWMLPVYGLGLPLFEPLHERLRRARLPVRAIAYAGGFSAVEYSSGRVLRRILGSAPWDYSHARWHVDGLVQAGYLPVWAAAGLGFERLHDRLL